ELHGARVVHTVSRGYGSALRRGIEEAKGQFIIVGDGDDSYDFSEIDAFVAKWHEGYEFIIGNRFLGEIKTSAMPWHHKYIGTPVLSAVVNLFFRAGVGDINCGLRGFTKHLANRLDFRTTGMEFASESLIKAAKLGVRLTEVPITLWPDKRGRPPIFAASTMVGGTCASCCCVHRIGCFCFPVPFCLPLDLVWFSVSFPDRVRWGKLSLTSTQCCSG